MKQLRTLIDSYLRDNILYDHLICDEHFKDWYYNGYTQTLSKAENDDAFMSLWIILKRKKDIGFTELRIYMDIVNYE